MPAPSFDLIDVIRTIKKQNKLIITITAISVVLGGAFYAIKKKKYKGVAKFMVTNPLYNDRNTLFRNHEQRYVDYYGGDDDVDRVSSFLNSDTVRDRIIRNCQFHEVYKSDINSLEGHVYLMDIFNKNLNVKRSEYKDIEVTYTAYDAVTAANVANMTVKVLEETFRVYYNGMKNDMYQSIQEKLAQLDSNIVIYTDSLSNVEAAYARDKELTALKAQMGVHAAGAVWGEELIKNIRSVKDQLVVDRAKYISLVNEFETTTNNKMTYLKQITRATPPAKPSGATLPIVIVIAGLLGFFISSLVAMMKEYYSRLMAVER